MLEESTTTREEDFVDIGGSDDDDARIIRTFVLYELKKVVVREVVETQMAIEEQQRDEEEEEEETANGFRDHAERQTPVSKQLEFAVEVSSSLQAQHTAGTPVTHTIPPTSRFDPLAASYFGALTRCKWAVRWCERSWNNDLYQLLPRKAFIHKGGLWFVKRGASVKIQNGTLGQRARISSICATKYYKRAT
jgi:hypothetical protein